MVLRPWHLSTMLPRKLASTLFYVVVGQELSCRGDALLRSKCTRSGSDRQGLSSQQQPIQFIQAVSQYYMM